MIYNIFSELIGSAAKRLLSEDLLVNVPGTMASGSFHGAAIALKIQLAHLLLQYSV